jgi:hypothetical protein
MANSEYDSILDKVLEEYLERHDPVRRAERAKKPAEFCARRKSRRLNSAEKHAVNRRDGGRCTYIDESGQRCANERWLHIHHITPVSAGGGNEAENLTTLCSYHHDLVHQLSLFEPRTLYTACVEPAT